MIPKAITAPFRWWAKHPWTAFWGSIPVFYLLGGLFQPSVFVSRIMLLPLAIVLILSFIRGMFLQWQRSKILIAVGYIVLVVLIGFISAIAIPQFANHRRWGYDRDVKANLKIAAKAEKAYFAVHHTFTNEIGSITGYGFNQSQNVIITAGTNETTFVITGKSKKGCSTDSGIWYLNGSTGKITGTRCR